MIGYGLIINYMKIILMIILDIFLIFFLYRNYRSGKYSKINIVLKTTIIIVIIIFTLGTYIMNGIRDVPYIIDGNYKTIKGYALNGGYADTQGGSIILIEDEDTKENLCLHIYYHRDIKAGDWYEVRYLPNQKIGNVCNSRRVDRKNY